MQGNYALPSGPLFSTSPLPPPDEFDEARSAIRRAADALARAYDSLDGAGEGWNQFDYVVEQLGKARAYTVDAILDLGPRWNLADAQEPPDEDDDESDDSPIDEDDVADDDRKDGAA